VSAPFVVGVAGGSGSGKTALCRALAGALGPERVAMLCHDAYYRDRSELPAAERAALNYDVPDALDTPLFLEHLRALRAGLPARPPRYCFSTHRRIGEDAVVEPRPVLLMEGILLLHEAEARRLLDLALFLDVPTRCAWPGASRATRASADAPTARCSRSSRPPSAARTRLRRADQGLRRPVLSNVGRVDRVAETAAGVVRERLARRRVVEAA